MKDDKASGTVGLSAIEQAPQLTIADQVFEALQQRILSLELPPETKISEADVARVMDVSRQPVREAFKRLEKLGFLRIRPQSSTMVTLISEEAIERAKFIRTALELHVVRTACRVITPAGLEALAALIAQQEAALARGDAQTFHALDDGFHKELCRQAGADYAWDLIQNSKAHMDRIRLLSLNSSSQTYAIEEHKVLLEAIAARDTVVAEAALTKHLDRILVLIQEVKAMDHSWFEAADS